MGIYEQALAIIEKQKAQAQQKIILKPSPETTTNSKTIKAIQLVGANTLIKTINTKDIIYKTTQGILGDMLFVANIKNPYSGTAIVVIDAILPNYQNVLLSVFKGVTIYYEENDFVRILNGGNDYKGGLRKLITPQIINKIEEIIPKIQKVKAEEYINKVLDTYNKQNQGEFIELDRVFVELAKEDGKVYTTEKDVFVAYGKSYKIKHNITIPRELQNKTIGGELKKIKYFKDNTFYDKDKIKQTEIYIEDREVELPKKIQGTVVKVNTDILSKISLAMDKGNPKFELNGVLLDVENGNMTIVATNTRVLSKSNSIKTNMPNGKYMISREHIPDVIKAGGIILKDNETFGVNYSNTECLFRFIQGRYPDYNRIFPQTLQNTLKLPSEFVAFINTTKFKELEVIIKQGIISIREMAKDTFFTKVANIADKDIDIVFGMNSNYMKIAFAKEQDITMSWNSEKLPFLFTTDSINTVVMPIVL